MNTYFNMDAQYAKFQGNPHYQATKQHLTDKRLETFFFNAGTVWFL